MRENLISIIVPVYNVERYIRDCLESIAAQTYGNFECIIVDDGSTDSSGAICDEFCAGDPRFRVLHQANVGVAAARNRALDECKGEWICFVDGDDLTHPQMLEMLYGEANDSCLLTVCDFESHEASDAAKHWQKFPDRGEVEMVSGESAARDLFGGWIEGDYHRSWMFGVLWGKLYHRSLFENLRFDTSFVANSDQELNIKILLKVDRITVIGRELYYYQLRDYSLCHSDHEDYPFLFSAIKMCQSIPPEKANLQTVALRSLSQILIQERDKTSDKRDWDERVRPALRNFEKLFYRSKNISARRKVYYCLKYHCPHVSGFIKKLILK